MSVGFTFLVLADSGSPRKRAVKRVCVCVCVVREVARKLDSVLCETSVTEHIILHILVT